MLNVAGARLVGTIGLGELVGEAVICMEGAGELVGEGVLREGRVLNEAQALSKKKNRPSRMNCRALPFKITRVMSLTDKYNSARH